MRELIGELNVPNVKANKKTEQFISNFLKDKIGTEKLNEELQKQSAITITNASTDIKSTQVIFFGFLDC